MDQRLLQWIPNKKEHVQKTVALTLVFLVSSLLLLPFEDEIDTTSHHRGLSLNVLQPDEDDFCIAIVNDGNITTAAVMDKQGNFSLALPKDYETTFTVECTKYTRLEPTTEKSAIKETYTDTGVAIQGGDYEPSSSDCDDRMSFQPGYYDHRTKAWYDHCAGRQAEAEEGALSYHPEESYELRSSELMSQVISGSCPVSNEKEDIWVSFVGDSVTRQLYELIMDEYELPYEFWITGRNTRKRHDHMLGSISSLADRSIWMSYEFNHISQDDGGRSGFDIHHTWEAYQNRGGPDFAKDRVPDIVFYSPGYHASELTSERFGSVTEEILTQWQDAVSNLDGPMPKMYIMLNMMPAPWRIPKNYLQDVSYRTLLNEYRKNKAIIAGMKKFDFVKGVVDLFSIELPFNGKQGATAHHDAVHLFQDSIPEHVAGDRIVNTICHSE